MAPVAQAAVAGAARIHLTDAGVDIDLVAHRSATCWAAAAGGGADHDGTRRRGRCRDIVHRLDRKSPTEDEADYDATRDGQPAADT